MTLRKTGVEDGQLHENSQDGVFTGLAHGQDTTATSGSAEPLNGGTSLELPEGATLYVKALGGNGGTVYVGDSDVSTSNGFELAAGEKIPLKVSDVSNVYVDVDTGGEGVSWIAEQ